MIGAACSRVLATIMNPVIQLDRFKNNTQAIQRVSQAGDALIGIIDRSTGNTYLPKFKAALSSLASVQNFTGFLSIPADICNGFEYRRQSILEFLSSLSFAALDAVSVPIYLRGWKIDPMTPILQLAEKAGLGDRAKSLGQTKVFRWASGLELEPLAWSLCGFAFAYQGADLIQKIQNTPYGKTPLGKQEKYTDMISLISSVAEVGLSFANYRGIAKGKLEVLTFIIKGIGIYRSYCEMNTHDMKRKQFADVTKTVNNKQ